MTLKGHLRGVSTSRKSTQLRVRSRVEQSQTGWRRHLFSPNDGLSNGDNSIDYYVEDHIRHITTFKMKKNTDTLKAAQRRALPHSRGRNVKGYLGVRYFCPLVRVARRYQEAFLSALAAGAAGRGIRSVGIVFFLPFFPVFFLPFFSYICLRIFITNVENREQNQTLCALWWIQMYVRNMCFVLLTPYACTCLRF